MRFSLFCFLLMITPCFANETASIEAEALEIADQLQCLVCSDTHIETAKDETAKDLRFFIRKHLTDGKSQELVLNLVLANYGDMVSLEIEQNPVPNKNEELFIKTITAFFFCLMLFSIYRRAKAFKKEKRA